MISIFTCGTKDCANAINPVYLMDAVNPVMCGNCHEFGEAVQAETQESTE